MNLETKTSTNYKMKKHVNFTLRVLQFFFSKCKLIVKIKR
jgi:hypothetical protein